MNSWLFQRLWASLTAVLVLASFAFAVIWRCAPGLCPPSFKESVVAGVLVWVVTVPVVLLCFEWAERRRLLAAVAPSLKEMLRTLALEVHLDAWEWHWRSGHDYRGAGWRLTQASRRPTLDVAKDVKQVYAEAKTAVALRLAEGETGRDMYAAGLAEAIHPDRILGMLPKLMTVSAGYDDGPLSDLRRRIAIWHGSAISTRHGLLAFNASEPERRSISDRVTEHLGHAFDVYAAIERAYAALPGDRSQPS